jgi:hypothetical protein
MRANDGTGEIIPDCFADARLLMMPPASCALLILLNRNHNVRTRVSVLFSLTFECLTFFPSILPRGYLRLMNVDDSRIPLLFPLKTRKSKTMRSLTAAVLSTADISCKSSLEVRFDHLIDPLHAQSPCRLCRCHSRSRSGWL